MLTPARETQPTGPGETAIAPAIEFERLLECSYNRAYNAAYRMMGNASDAEDLTQEAYVRAWAAFDRYDRARPFEGWLFRILSNLAIDRWRRLSAASVCSLDAASSARTGSRRHVMSGAREGNGASLLAYLADERPGAMPEQSFLRAETGRRVRRALSALPGDYRKAVVLADVKGYSYEEIARRVGCPVGTIRSRLHRGRQLLRQNLIRIQSQEDAADLTETAERRENRERLPRFANAPNLGSFALAE